MNPFINDVAESSAPWSQMGKSFSALAGWGKIVKCSSAELLFISFQAIIVLEIKSF